ncbi:MAG: hypothetical protein JSU08_01700 [Acidobacteria bacterium]|nr:hypothetical protein [Acidobacteriota bacterium]
MATMTFGTRVRQFVCGLHGHDSLLEFGRGRLSLKCVSCGHETPGWDLKTRPAHEQQPPDTTGPAHVLHLPTRRLA